MPYRTTKPKQTAQQLVCKMKNKGITFKYISEADAANYLANVNNYLRTAAYRKNYQKHNKGVNSGKYIDLDFSYLQELSTFGDFIKFYEFYYSSRKLPKISSPIISLVKSLRNGVAHNNCILAVSDKVKYHRIKELKSLFGDRMLHKKGFFQKK